jgi:hypothetical protein
MDFPPTYPTLRSVNWAGDQYTAPVDTSADSDAQHGHWDSHRESLNETIRAPFMPRQPTVFLPKSTVENVEVQEISITASLNSREKKNTILENSSSDMYRSLPERQVWLLPRLSISDLSCDTELSVVHSSEYCFDGKGKK